MNNELAEWIVKAIETIKSGVVDELVKYLEDLKSKAEATKELREENELLKNSDSLCKLIGEQKLKITDLENKLANADYQLEGRDLEIKELEKENAELKKQVEQKQHLADVRLEQRIDVDIALEDTTDKLTKAKEIIKKLLATPRSIYGRDEDGELTSFFNSDYEELKKHAEQFLNSEVEK